MTAEKDVSKIKRKSGFFERWRSKANAETPAEPFDRGLEDVVSDTDAVNLTSVSEPAESAAEEPAATPFAGDAQQVAEPDATSASGPPGGSNGHAVKETPVDAECLGSDEGAAEQLSRPRNVPGLFSRALSKTGRGLEKLLLGGRRIDDELFEELETQLLVADVGMEVCTDIIATLTDRVKRRQLSDSTALRAELHEVMVDILGPCEQVLDVSAQRPFVILVVGVNGVGKTTTIGKLAKHFQQQGRDVMLAAGDTFRAAAVEQLQVWGSRNNVPVIAQHTGADSASVIYDAIESAKARQVDVLIADTAGRLHTKNNLMEELVKVKRVMAKLDDSAPHEVLLVLDAGTGQNAVRQVQEFNEAVAVTGLAVTKLDGTAKGGVVLALCQRFGIPLRYVGLGEGPDDLQVFDADAYVAAMLAENA